MFLGCKIAHVSVVKENITELLAIVFEFCTHVRVLNMLVNARALLYSKRQLFRFEHAEGSDSAQELGCFFIYGHLAKAPNTVHYSVELLATSIHQNLVRFRCRIVVVFRHLVKHSVISDLASYEAAFFVHHEHWRAYGGRLFTKLVTFNLAFCFCFLVEVSQASVIKFA